MSTWFTLLLSWDFDHAAYTCQLPKECHDFDKKFENFFLPKGVKLI